MIYAGILESNTKGKLTICGKGMVSNFVGTQKVKEIKDIFVPVS